MGNHSIALGLIGMALTCSSVAQQAGSAAGLYRISIPVEPLGDALSQLAQQTGLQVMLPSHLAEGVQSAELKGTFSAEEALQKLLANTGLQFTFVNPHTVAINGPSATTGSGRSKSATKESTDAKNPTVESESKPNSTEGGKKMQNRGFIARMLGLFAVCGTATHSGTACAQAADATDSVALEAVIVTAQRREERLQDVPLTVVAMSEDQLEKSGVTNIFDLQTVVSGLTYSGVGNSTQPAIRGLNTLVSTNGSENPNALYVDGVYYATNQLFGANLPDVSRIEVLKGPQGTLFGRNSTGGAVRIFTKDPTFDPSGDFAVDAGYYTGDGTSRSNPHYAFRGFVAGPLAEDRVAASVSLGYDKTDGFLTDDTTGKKFGAIERVNMRTKLLITPSDAFRAVLSAYYLQHDDTGLQSQTPVDGLVVTGYTVAGVPMYPGSVTPIQPYHTAYDSGLGLDINVADVKSHGLSANLTYELGDVGTLTAITGWNNNDIDNLTTFAHARGSAACIASFACVDYSYYFKLQAFSQELNFSSKQLGMFRTTAGLFYYHQHSTTDAYIQATIIPGGSFVKSEQFLIDSYAAYGELEITPMDQLTFTAGGRYTHEPHEDSATGVPTKKITFNSFVPRVTAKFAATPELNVYASYAKGEKSGLSGIANTASNPQYAPVDPEENNAYEVGVKYAAPTLSGSIAAFYYDYKNKQEQGFTGTSVFLLNSGPVRIDGFDADFSVRLSREFKLRANATWLETAEYRDFPNATGYALGRNANGSFTRVYFDATGQRLAKAPELTANLTLDYALALSGGTFDASANVSYSSKVYHDLNQIIVQPAYTTLSARAGYAFGDSGLQLSLYGRNLTNKAYITSGFSSGVGYTAAYARPREIGLNLKFSY